MSLGGFLSVVVLHNTVTWPAYHPQPGERRCRDSDGAGRASRRHSSGLIEIVLVSGYPGLPLYTIQKLSSVAEPTPSNGVLGTMCQDKKLGVPSSETRRCRKATGAPPQTLTNDSRWYALRLNDCVEHIIEKKNPSFISTIPDVGDIDYNHTRNGPHLHDHRRRLTCLA